MKKLIISILSLLMAVSLTACSSAKEERPEKIVGANSADVNAGTYSTIVTGHNGEMTIETTVDETLRAKEYSFYPRDLTCRSVDKERSKVDF